MTPQFKGVYILHIKNSCLFNTKYYCGKIFRGHEKKAKHKNCQMYELTDHQPEKPFQQHLLNIVFLSNTYTERIFNSTKADTKSTPQLSHNFGRKPFS